MLTYLGVSPGLYARFILKNGKPIQFTEKLPAPSNLIVYSADHMDPIIYEGQDLYNLLGWAFLREMPDQSQYDRFLVLQSASTAYFFPMESVKRPDVQKAFLQLNIDIQDSGFMTYIAKDVIRPGTYQIGIVFKQRSGNSIYYIVATNKQIVRTPNQFTMEIGGVKPVISTEGSLVTLPDLKITNLTITPSPISPNDDIHISVDVANLKGGNANTFRIEFYIDDNWQSCWYLGVPPRNYFARAVGLDGNKSGSWSFTIPAGGLTPGTHTISAYVDSGCEVVEFNKGNNNAGSVSVKVSIP